MDNIVNNLLGKVWQIFTRFTVFIYLQKANVHTHLFPAATVLLVRSSNHKKLSYKRFRKGRPHPPPLMLPFISIMPLEKNIFNPLHLLHLHALAIYFLFLSSHFQIHLGEQKLYILMKWGVSSTLLKAAAFTVCRHWWTVRLRCHPDSCI